MERSAFAVAAMHAFLAARLLAAPDGAWARTTWKPDRPVEILVTCQLACGPGIAARTIQKIW